MKPTAKTVCAKAQEIADAVEIVCSLRDTVVYRGRAWWLLNNAGFYLIRDFWRAVGKPCPSIEKVAAANHRIAYASRRGYARARG
jgi:hypothetical protein